MALTIGQAGYGYWGRNLLRVFSNAKGTQLVAGCDSSAEARSALAKDFPGIEVHESYAALLARPNLDAVILATPADQHHDQVRRALEAGKQSLEVARVRRRVAADQVGLVVDVPGEPVPGWMIWGFGAQPHHPCA